MHGWRTDEILQKPKDWRRKYISRILGARELISATCTPEDLLGVSINRFCWNLVSDWFNWHSRGFSNRNFEILIFGFSDSEILKFWNFDFWNFDRPPKKLFVPKTNPTGVADALRLWSRSVPRTITERILVFSLYFWKNQVLKFWQSEILINLKFWQSVSGSDASWNLSRNAILGM